MVASSLVDSVFSHGGSTERFLRAVAQLVQTALNDLVHIEKLDDSLAPEDPSQFDRNTAALIRDEYECWAANAGALLERIDGFEQIAANFPDTLSLRHAYGKTRARLAISLDDMEEGLRASSEGRVVSAEEVRRDLRLRVH